MEDDDAVISAADIHDLAVIADNVHNVLTVWVFMH